MSYYESYLTPPKVEPTTTTPGSLYQGTISGSYILLQPQIITIRPISIKSVGATTTMPGTGNLYVYIVHLQPNVSVYVSINGVNIPLSAGSNKIPLPGGVEVGPILLVNNNDEETIIMLWAFLAG